MTNDEVPSVIIILRHMRLQTSAFILTTSITLATSPDVLTLKTCPMENKKNKLNIILHFHAIFMILTHNYNYTLHPTALLFYIWYQSYWCKDYFFIINTSVSMLFSRKQIGTLLPPFFFFFFDNIFVLKVEIYNMQSYVVWLDQSDVDFVVEIMLLMHNAI